MSTDRAKQAIDLVQHCTDMLDVRRNGNCCSPCSKLK